MATKLVNGERIEMTPAEESAFNESRANISVVRQKAPIDLLIEKLKAKDILTAQDEDEIKGTKGNSNE